MSTSHKNLEIIFSLSIKPSLTINAIRWQEVSVEGTLGLRLHLVL